MQIPTLINEGSRKVTFREQIELHLSTPVNTPDTALLPSFTFEDASDVLILEALKELLLYVKQPVIDPSDLQEAFNGQFPDDVQGNGLSVVPNCFVLQNIDRLDIKNSQFLRKLVVE